MNTIKIDKRHTSMIAHRGLSGIETENTVNAFLAAANRSYYGMECDVYASKDGQIIITHDDSLLRLGLRDLYLPGLDYDIIVQYPLIDVKTGTLSRHVTTPLLADLFSICRTYHKQAVVELKEHLTTANLDEVVRLIRTFGMVGLVTLIAFDENYLLYLRARHPDLDLYLLCCEITEHVLEFCERNRMNLDAEYVYVNGDVITRLHRSGLKLNAWTVDDKDAAEQLADMGIDFITSNILE